MDQQLLFGESYHKKFDPKIYLQEKFTDVDSSPLKTSPLKPLYNFYKSYSATHSKGLEVLDLGCGPTIAYVISAAEYASQIVLAEYTEPNRVEITKWIEKHSDAHDWTPFFKYVITEVEGRRSEEIATREEKLRNAIKAVVPCDLTKDPVMGSEYMQEYDVVQAFLCLEAASSSKDDFVSILKRIWTLTKPGGAFILYSVQRKEQPGPGVYDFGGTLVYNLRVSVEFVRSSLLTVGFDNIETVPLMSLKEQAGEHCSFTLFICYKTE